MTPSFDHAMLLVEPSPTAIYKELPYATLRPKEKIVVPPVAVHCVPLDEYAILLVVPLPIATHLSVPLYTIPFTVLNTVYPKPVQFIPSYE